MKTIYAVIDTNVLVSGLLSPFGAPGRIVDMLRTGDLKAVVDDRVCHEYKDVLLHPEFGFPPSDVDILLDQIMSNASFPEINADDIIENMNAPGDIPFAECALAAKCPMATGNLRHFKHLGLRSATVLSPSEFLKLVSRNP